MRNLRNPIWMNAELVSSFLILLHILQISSTSAKGIITSDTISRCPGNCGNVKIQYPFGIGENCFYPRFEVVCDDEAAYFAESNLQLLEISEGQVRINSSMLIATSCPPLNDSTGLGMIVLPESSPLSFSVLSNKYVFVGYMHGGTFIDTDLPFSVYIPRCSYSQSNVNHSCIGEDCCNKSALSFLYGQFQRSVSVVVGTIYKPQLPIFGTCSYGFVVEDETTDATISALQDTNRTVNVTMKLEWAIGNESCSKEEKTPIYVCGGNTTCVDSNRRRGYLCKCLDGYEGNPYLGCQDINECELFRTNSCVETAKCNNEIPGFKCICPKGTVGDGKKDGVGCINKQSSLSIFILGPVRFNFIIKSIDYTKSCSTCVVAFFVIIAICFSWFYWVSKQRSLARVRAEYFKKNGGILLEKQLTCLQGSAKCIRIYSAHELEMATNKYNNSRILGTGGNGTVYKGILDDGFVVAIKKSQVIAHSQIDQFINEIVILSQINHKNVVRILGCCLETQVPMLVYEFIPNGSLYESIHRFNNHTPWVCWETRFQIAVQTAEALTYLHSSTSMPIFHRDVKTSNILLDYDYTAKIADFGVSKLVPLEKTRISTAIQGTFGYLDPEYFNTGKLTGKSDVYSFGVVLLELLTGRKPVWPYPSMDFCNLTTFFLSYHGSGNMIEALDERVVGEADFEELKAVASIARRCLRVKGEERPTMREVAQELITLRVRLA